MGYGLGLVCAHLIRYPCPLSIGSLWNVGVVLGYQVCSQVWTGILLGLHYTPSTRAGYHSVQGIMREVYYGSMYRYQHQGGASMVLVLVWVHVCRGVFHGSYVLVSSVLALGTLVYLLMVALAFMGYVLPRGCMSYWGATVITNLLVPVPDMVAWLQGGFYISLACVSRYFILHLVVPVLVSVFLVFHVLYVHQVGSGGGTGYHTNTRAHFHVWLVCKDTLVLVQGLVGVLVQGSQGIVMLVHPDNQLEASVVHTPLHLVPEWYYLGYYSVLKAVPGTTTGILAMVSHILGIGVYGEPYSASTGISGWSGYTGRYTGVGVLVLGCGYQVWVGVQLPQVQYIYYTR